MRQRRKTVEFGDGMESRRCSLVKNGAQHLATYAHSSPKILQRPESVLRRQTGGGGNRRIGGEKQETGRYQWRAEEEEKDVRQAGSSVNLTGVERQKTGRGQRRAGQQRKTEDRQGLVESRTAGERQKTGRD